ncbi:MAG: UDP-N-acetylmuramoylalanyl-D-glutamyl-2,6-diaminopimelate--D-alanyl-D-alanine ligase [Alphaproteobacteria bacterium]
MSAAPLWTDTQAAAATGGRNTAHWAANGVSIDSRSLAPRDLFVALQGPSFDGHDFIAKAFENGAAATLSHRRPAPGGPAASPGPLLLVEDTMAALRGLGAAARARSRARFIGVTGSVGKTSIKEALARCLRAQAPTAANASSLNNHWGLPLSLSRLPHDAVYGVFELGMNHPGEIRDLTGLLRPDVALITNIEAVHIGHFDSVEQIADAKAEIFEDMPSAGAAVLNRDNPHFARLAEKARAAGVGRVIGFGRDAAAEARLIDCTLEATGSRVEAEILGERLSYRVGLPGSHWVANSLAVLATVAAAGADVARAAEELAGIEAVAGRGVRRQIDLHGGSFTLIDDSYNANVNSMRAAFEVLGRAVVGSTTTGTRGRRIAILGDMLELGACAREMHLALAQPLQDAGVDLVLTCGSEMAALQDALPAALRGGHAADSSALAPLATATLAAGDVVSIKGSLGSRMKLLVEALSNMAQDLPRAANGA